MCAGQGLRRHSLQHPTSTAHIMLKGEVLRCFASHSFYVLSQIWRREGIMIGRAEGRGISS